MNTRDTSWDETIKEQEELHKEFMKLSPEEQEAAFERQCYSWRGGKGTPISVGKNITKMRIKRDREEN